MRAIVCERLGDPELLVLREVPSPTPGPGEVKVALRARGISFVDVLVIAGRNVLHAGADLDDHARGFATGDEGDFALRLVLAGDYQDVDEADAAGFERHLHFARSRRR